MHRFYLQRTRLNRGGYDAWKRYWGTGAPLYWYFCGDCNDPEVRSRDISARKTGNTRGNSLKQHTLALLFTADDKE